MSLTERYAAAFPRLRRLHEQARGVFPDGVTHDLGHLEPFPVYIDRARGARTWDVDGHELIDCWAGHGALLLGHGHPAVVAAVRRQVERGTHLGGWRKSLQASFGGNTIVLSHLGSTVRKRSRRCLSGATSPGRLTVVRTHSACAVSRRGCGQ
jgi:glutamate-1-semialdehyde 2,1-aminomutase